MRVLIVSDCYAPRLGGIETQVRDLARNLLAAGHEPAVVTATPDGPGRGRSVEGPDGFPVFRTTVPLPGELPVHPRGRREIEAVMERWRPEVVHAHVGIVSPFAWSGIAAARRQGLSLAVTFHCVLGPWARAGAALGPLSPVSRWRGIADITAVSSMLAREVERAGARGGVTVLPNGITLDHWRLERPDGPDGPRPLRVVASLRWIERKRPLQVVRAFTAAVERSGADAVLEMYGDGPLRDRLAQEAADSPVADRITLVGRLERSELARAFTRADIYLQTSPADSFGISVLEARAAGLAVVALGSSGVADFITDGVEGLLADDDAGLASALTALLEDPALLARMKEHNYAVAPPLQWGDVVERNVEAYRRAIALRRR
ncbi:glycosyltransferase [Actinomyces bowdenii]|uniref:glycosyltransferase n=1 Tax=Actinomyces bowdenii TaxID=131109 RepID=UPI001ABC763D|nr:glycosyltransferase [Actinomyces bowdenii]